MRKRWKTIAAIVFFIIIFALFSRSRFYLIFKNPETLKSYIVSFGSLSFIVYFLVHLVQVIIFFIPGELIEIAGGYIFGTYFGSLLSVLGIMTGSFIAYTLGNIFGAGLIKKIIPESSISYFKDNFGSRSINLAIFIVYLIPGMPKDALAYICGISNISRRNFLTYSTIGRIPCIAVSSYFGETLGRGDLKTAAGVTLVMTILFTFGLIKGDNIIRKITRKDENNSK